MEKFKSIFNIICHNLGLKILAVLAAFVIWVWVVNATDPLDIVTFTNIPVLVINEDSLVAKDKIPEILDGKTITVSIEARKSICDNLSASDIFAVADYEKINVVDAVPIEIAISGVNSKDYDIIKGSNQFMKLSLEDYATKEFKIKVETVGEPSNGYVVAKTVASPNFVSVYGSKMQISRIRDIVVKVDVTGVKDDQVEISTPIVYDMNDEPIYNSKLELSTGAVAVTTTIYKTKIMPVKVITVGEPKEGYKVNNITYQPSQVVIYGSDEELALVGNVFNVTVDIDGKSSNIEQNIDIMSLIHPTLETIGMVEDDETLGITVYMGVDDKPASVTENTDEETGVNP